MKQFSPLLSSTSNFSSRLTITQGFSLAEVIVSLLILSVILSTIGPIMMTQFALNYNSDRRLVATAIAQYYLEQYRNNTRTSLPSLAEAIDNTITADCTNFPVCRRLSNGTTRPMTFGVTIRVRDLSGRNADGSLNCVTAAAANSQARCIRVTVRPFSTNTTNPVIYETETAYTLFANQTL